MFFADANCQCRPGSGFTQMTPICKALRRSLAHRHHEYREYRCGGAIRHGALRRQRVIQSRTESMAGKRLAAISAFLVLLPSAPVYATEHAIESGLTFARPDGK